MRALGVVTPGNQALVSDLIPHFPSNPDTELHGTGRYASVIWPRPKKFNAATNALLAEHLLGLVELVPGNPFSKEIADTIVRLLLSSNLWTSRDDVVAFFNSEPRFTQLNVIAMALNELGHMPLLSKEIWQPVKNPLLPDLADQRHIDAVAQRLNAKHSVSIAIPPRRFQIVDWGLAD